MKLTLADPWPVWSAALFAVVAIGLVLLSGRWLPREIDRRARHGLVLLRVLAVALLLLLLFEPVLTRDRLESDDLVTVVLVDRSRSMSVRDSYGGRARYLVAADFLGADATGLISLLSDDFRLTFVSFDEAARDASAGEVHGEAPPDGRLTDLAGALASAESAASRSETIAVVLLSDGAGNAGGDPQAAAKELGVPVYTVGFGSRGEAAGSRKDIVLLSVDAPETAFSENTVVAKVTVRSTGFALEDPGNRRARIVLMENEVEIQVAWAEFAREAGTVRVPIRFVPEGAGPHTYRVVIPVRGDEAIAENNDRAFSLEVLERRAAVLYFDATLRWEAKFLRDLLARDPAVDLTSVLHAGRGRLLVHGETHGADLSRGLPSRPQDWDRFDVIILGDVPAQAVGRDRLEGLRHRVESGAGLLLLGGYQAFGPGGYADTPLAEAFPVFVSKEDGQIEDEATLSITPSGRVHPILSGLAPWFGGETRPSLRGLTEVGREKPGAQILLSAGGATVLAVQRYGEGRAAAFTGDTTWVWHRSAELTGLHQRFWGQVLRWLLSEEPTVERTGKPVELLADRPTYRIGERIRILATAAHPDGADVSGTVTAPSIERALEFRPLRGAPGSFEATLPAREPGTYVFRARATRDGAELGTAELSVAVDDATIEMDDVDLDDERLAAIARASGGCYYHSPPTAEALARDIRGSLVGLVERSEIDLSNSPLFFMVFVALVSAEWFLRRRRNIL